METPTQPEPRVFASLTTVGSYICLLGGRTGDQHMIPKDRSLRVFCTQANSWLETKCRALDARSSHR